MLLEQKIPKKDLNKILDEFDLGRVLKTKPMLTSGNIAYLIKTEKGKFVLRLCPEGPRFRSKGEITAELEFIDYLLKNGFPTPVPITKKNSQRIIKWRGKFGYLRKFDDGKSILNPGITQIKKFGQTVGWLHNLSCSFKPKNKRKHIFNPEETKKYFKSNKKFILKSNFKNKEEFVKKLEKELSELDFPENIPQGMIHEDLGRRHILWKGGNKISCILDFDRCYYGKFVLDLGQVCRGWCFINNWREWSNRNFQALICAYQNKRKLSKFEKKYLTDAIKFGILERSIAFCLRFIEATKDIEDERFANHSLFTSMDLIEHNRKKIEKFLKIE